MNDKNLIEVIEKVGVKEAIRILKGGGSISGKTWKQLNDSGESIDELRHLAHAVRHVLTGINGEEDRKDVVELLEQLQQQEVPGQTLSDNIKAVALLAHKSRLVEERGGMWTLMTEKHGEVQELCPGERFFDYPVSNPATAFLVREDLVVTLRHNLLPPYFSGLDTIRVIFDFELRVKGDPESCKVNFSRDEVFEIIDQYSLADDSPHSFVALRLSRPVEGRKPVMCNFGVPIGARERIYMIGHPCGLPKIHAGNAIVLNASSAKGFTASLDAFAGNSGSPVFDEDTGLVEGVLANGGDDFRQKPGGGCYFTNVYEPTALYPYGVVRIQKLQRLLGP